MALPAQTTPREEIAQATARAVVATSGVVALRAPRGSVHVTEVAGRRIEGVSVVTAGQGRYDVTVQVVALPVPLYALADTIRAQVRGFAAEAGLEGSVADIDVLVDDVLETGAHA